MQNVEGTILITDYDRYFAMYSFTHSIAMARIRRVFKTTLKRAREKIAAKKGLGSL